MTLTLASLGSRLATLTTPNAAWQLSVEAQMLTPAGPSIVAAQTPVIDARTVERFCALPLESGTVMALADNPAVDGEAMDALVRWCAERLAPQRGTRGAVSDESARVASDALRRLMAAGRPVAPEILDRVLAVASEPWQGTVNARRGLALRVALDRPDLTPAQIGVLMDRWASVPAARLAIAAHAAAEQPRAWARATSPMPSVEVLRSTFIGIPGLVENDTVRQWCLDSRDETVTEALVGAAKAHAHSPVFRHWFRLLAERSPARAAAVLRATPAEVSLVLEAADVLPLMRDTDREVRQMAMRAVSRRREVRLQQAAAGGGRGR